MLCTESAQTANAQPPKPTLWPPVSCHLSPQPNSQKSPVLGPRGAGQTFPLPKTRPLKYWHPQIPTFHFHCSDPESRDCGQPAFGQRSRRRHARTAGEMKVETRLVRVPGGGARAQGSLTGPPRWVSVRPRPAPGTTPVRWAGARPPRSSRLSNRLPGGASVALSPPRPRQLLPGPPARALWPAQGRGRGGEVGTLPPQCTHSLSPFRKVCIACSQLLLVGQT